VKFTSLPVPAMTLSTPSPLVGEGQGGG